MSGVESYLTEPPAHRPRWFGDVGIVLAALAVFGLVASTLSWCDLSVQSFRLSAPVPVLLCPGGPSAGELSEGTTARVTAVYSGDFGDFSEVTDGDDVAGWAEASDIDAATGVTTADVFAVPRVTDPAFDGPDCTSSATTTTVDTTVDTTALDTTVPETTTATTAAGLTTSTARTTVPRTTARPTTTQATATTQPTTTTTRDVRGPTIGTIRLNPSTLNEQGSVIGGASCDPDDAIARVTVRVTDDNGVKSVSYEARVKDLTEKGDLTNAGDVYSGTVGPFENAFGPNDKASTAVIAVIITAIDDAGNTSTATAAGALVRCTPPPPTTTTTSTTVQSTTVFGIP